MGMLDLLLGGYSAYQGLQDADDLVTYGQQIGNDMNALGQQLASGSQFQGYGVTSALGNTSVGQDGSVNMGVGPNMGCRTKPTLT